MRNSSALVSFLGGLLVGAAIVALTTPRTGKEVRGQIRDFADDTVEAARKKAEKARKAVGTLRNRVREELASKLDNLETEVRGHKA